MSSVGRGTLPPSFPQGNRLLERGQWGLALSKYRAGSVLVEYEETDDSEARRGRETETERRMTEETDDSQARRGGER